MFGFLIPKKFLCRYPLSLGAFAGGIVVMIVTIICTIVLLVEVLLMNSSDARSRFYWKNAYGFSITGIVYNLLMVILDAFMLCAVNKKKTSILISWVVITGIWLGQTFCVLSVLLIIYSREVSLVSWILSFVFGLIGTCILIYIILVVYGFWIELKKEAVTNKSAVNLTNK